MKLLLSHRACVFLTISAILLAGCSSLPDPPPLENEEEVISDITLSFIPIDGGDNRVFRASDPDGDGPQDIGIPEDIVLMPKTTYELRIEFENVIAGESITEEVREEANEHQLFFEWSEGLFIDPPGDGNIDNSQDAVKYLDFDKNDLPLGLVTQWETGETISTGQFRLMLKHQPDIKTNMSGSETGDTDVDLSWTIHISN